ncbi:MAG TPA: ATP-binding protein [Bacteroidales bacterium]|nr:ATP-binding protein [Bacteroidales bacterium]HPI86993.1 ATP-binding protein [Bacteroidales bacterium]HPM93345.1 ATP-binding protein [Bacteroidales bacterium]
MKIVRKFQDLGSIIQPNKVLLILGPRQVGKTTLMKDYLKKSPLRYKFITGDDLLIQKPFVTQSLSEIKSFCEGYDLLAIDEAQKIPNIGAAMKLMVDNIPGLHVIATGSSSFELAGQTGEPLTGRKTTLLLYPVAQMELLNHFNKFELGQKINDFLVYGGYPEVITRDSLEEKRKVLNEITGSYLFKDILAFERIRNPQFLIDLLRMLAFQIGSEVSVNELSVKLGIDNKTVKKYIELLEKSFILHTVRGYSGNLRKEISKKPKFYFYDTGIRNAIIANFNPPETRNDLGQLWENFIVMERIKKQTYLPLYANNYFWRSWTGKEVDFIEEREGKLFGFEIKWSNARTKVPSLWLESYPEATFEIINKDNYLEFIT